jgi:hypothetical protein
LYVATAAVTCARVIPEWLLSSVLWKLLAASFAEASMTFWRLG